MLSCVLAAAWCGSIAAQTRPATPVYIPFEEARPALESLPDFVPEELKNADAAATLAMWPKWIAKADAQIRGRLAAGDEDSLVNLLLFGTSFTTRPRLTARRIETVIGSSPDPAVSGAKLDELTQGRVDDLIRGAGDPGANERLAFAQRVFGGKGFALTTAEGQRQAKTFLLRALSRVLKEIDTYNRMIAQAERSDAPGVAFAERSGLYRARGLSSDTSLASNFAVEEALKTLAANRYLPNPIRRVAIIGAGLDFTDKQEGYDFYPQQTLQPFAVIDTLLRLRLAHPGNLNVTSFDLSPRVNAHLRALAAQGRNGRAYVLQLPLDASEKWRAPFVAYWSAFGDRIGENVKPLAAPTNAGALELRAVSVRPEVAASIQSTDLNVVLQRFELPPEGRFDLVLATNVFLYYNELERALAMANIQAMVHPGAILLSNNALVELPVSRVRFAGATSVSYSERRDNGDTIVWYRCSE